MASSADGMSSLVDEVVRYDLAESTCPSLVLGELMTPPVLERLRALPLGYGGSRGSDELRGLIAEFAGVPSSAVLPTAGASAALFLTALSVVEPGTRVVVATPCFPPSRTVPEMLRAEVVGVPLSFDRRYRLDVDALAAALTPGTRLVSLASPQNPSGIRFAEDDVRALLAEVERRAPDAVVLVDETYRPTSFTDPSGAPPPSLAGLSPRVVTCASLSKSHGAPGLRVGWLTATDPALYERLRRARFNTLVCSNAPDEVLATEVLRQGGQILARRHRTLSAALRTLAGWAAEHADLVDFLPPDGGALCTLRLRGDVEPDRLHAALRARDARVAPGSWFGESDRVVRLGFGHLPAELFGPALDRLGEALRTAALSPVR